jgi:hypothetical protein
MHYAPAGEDAGYVIRASKIQGLVPMEWDIICNAVEVLTTQAETSSHIDIVWGATNRKHKI